MSDDKRPEQPGKRKARTKDPEVIKAEAEIDAAFQETGLIRLSYPQSAWTLLSVAEDLHFNARVVNPLEGHSAQAYVDSLINELTHPIRAAFELASRDEVDVLHAMVEEHYELAFNWLRAAADYNHYCSMFPLYHAGEIDLAVDGSTLTPSDWSEMDLSFEAYNRLVGDQNETAKPLDLGRVAPLIDRRLTTTRDKYSLRVDRPLVSQLISLCQTTRAERYTLPEGWKFHHFSLAEFREVYTCVQALALGHFLGRQLACARGIQGAGYASAVWTPRKNGLISVIRQNTEVASERIETVLRYLTFSEMGIRHPDVATQPLIDLGSERFAVSPFLFLNSDAERNLCVLLNQIPSERAVYSQLVDQKEEGARRKVIEELREIDLDFRHGQIGDTDVDLAIIDRTTKTCVCVEIKWFIEPAEIREALDRSKELSKGITQARKITDAFSRCDQKLLSLLDIDESYHVLSIVGSVNHIGRFGIQQSDVPIVKLSHLVTTIKQLRDLQATLSWLADRKYLPREGEDYSVGTIPIQCGKWTSRWYGIKPL